MARIKFSDAEKNTEKSRWFSLKNDGDSAFVQFFYDSLEEFPTFTVHKAKLSEKDMFEKSIDCLRNTGDPLDVCPMCKDHQYVTAEVYAVLYNHDEKEVQIWRLSKSMQGVIKNQSMRCDSFKNRVWEIVRNGRAGDKATTYSLYPADGKVPVDLSKFDEPENFGIASKTSAEMRHYLQTGSWDMHSNPVPRNRREVESTPTKPEMPWGNDSDADFEALGTTTTTTEDFKPRRRASNTEAF